MQLTWLSLVPPLVVIGAMFFVNRLNRALLIGIMSAAIIVAQGNPFGALSLFIQKIIAHFSDVDMIFLYILLVVISSLIILLTLTGSAAGCARIIGKKMKTARSAEISSVLLAFLLSIDDYLSILTVGFVMRPIAERVGVVPAKLAYIIHALAGPLVIIVPISTWAAAILAQLDVSGINQGELARISADPFYVYLKTIPFIFYSLFTVVAVCFVVWSRTGYGAIGQAEENMNTVSVIEDIEHEQRNNQSHSLIELFMPIGILIGGVFLGILYAGDYYIFGGLNSFVEAFRQNDKTFLVLLLSSSGAFLASLIFSLFKNLIIPEQVPGIIKNGFFLIQNSIVMVIFASILGSFLRLDLHTGAYLASLLLGKAPLFLLPAMLFLVSLAVTLMTGSAWGAFSMLIPISTQMLLAFLQFDQVVTIDQIPILFPCLGAVLSGAACGNHLSPFAETTIMTASSTGIEPLEHATTQFIYAIPILVGTLISFLIAGLLSNRGLQQSFWMSAGAGIGIILIGFFILEYLKKGLK